jgi:isopenicillin N synthase-like dioxygenase
VADIPVIDLRDEDAPGRIDRACREHGFFSVTGHGIDAELLDRLLAASTAFFALPEDEKAEIAMARGGRAWRGWFPLAGELTSGVPDRKEGIYFGAEGAAGDPLPLHGPNLFPARPAELGPTVLAALDAFTALGHRLMGLLAVGLGLDAGWFARDLTADPTILFRIFHYPPEVETDGAGDWGVAEHTDYGLLTLLLQDASGGLQVRTGGEWRDIPPVPGALVCNLGDMLERLTGSAYHSTPHRVRNAASASRLSFPFFFDPGWDMQVPNLSGTYGDYVVQKVSNVFPLLGTEVLDDARGHAPRGGAR